MGEKLRIAGVVALYFAVSITLVFANKILMPSGAAKKDNDIDAPLFVTWFQCLLTAAIIYVLGWVAQGAAPDSWMKEFPKGQLHVTHAHSRHSRHAERRSGGRTRNRVPCNTTAHVPLLVGVLCASPQST